MLSSPIVIVAGARGLPRKKGWDRDYLGQPPPLRCGSSREPALPTPWAAGKPLNGPRVTPQRRRPTWGRRLAAGTTSHSDRSHSTANMSISALRFAGLNPEDRAIFAVNARLISCLVTESLLRALYLPIHGFEATGICVLLGNDVSSEPPSQQPCTSRDIVAVVPLRHVPVFRHDSADTRGKEIGLLDPLDMLPLVFEVDADGLKAGEAMVSFVHFSQRPLLKFMQY